jgi:hypothetical protein
VKRKNSPNTKAFWKRWKKLFLWNKIKRKKIYNCSNYHCLKCYSAFSVLFTTKLYIQHWNLQNCQNLFESISSSNWVDGKIQFNLFTLQQVHSFVHWTFIKQWRLNQTETKRRECDTYHPRPFWRWAGSWEARLRHWCWPKPTPGIQWTEQADLGKRYVRSHSH